MKFFQISEWSLMVIMLGLCGCGTPPSSYATRQLLLSDAMDRAIAGIDVHSLSGRTVYLKTTYLGELKGFGFANHEYLVSSLRQQLVASRCLLRDEPEEAEIILEVRVGACGENSHQMVYGITANETTEKLRGLFTDSPTPELNTDLAIARTQEKQAVTKLALFAYHRESGEPLWQSGIIEKHSNTTDLWILGSGPIQYGTLHDTLD